MKLKPTQLLLFLATTLIAFGCKKDPIERSQTVEYLYNLYKDGEISECIYHGDTVYSGGIHAFDAGSSIYNKRGDLIGECNYAWGPVDSICRKLTNCEVIYRAKSKNDYWGPAVDKYNLAH